MGMYNTHKVEDPKQHTHLQQIILYAQHNGEFRLLVLMFCWPCISV